MSSPRLCEQCQEIDISHLATQARFCPECRRERHLEQMRRSKRDERGGYKFKATVHHSLGHKRGEERIATPELEDPGTGIKYRVALAKSADHCRNLLRGVVGGDVAASNGWVDIDRRRRGQEKAPMLQALHDVARFLRRGWSVRLNYVNTLNPKMASITFERAGGLAAEAFLEIAWRE